MNARDVESAEWYGDLKKGIEQELAARRRQEPEVAAQLEAQKTKLEAQVQGWTLSLANPGLPKVVRTTLESSIADAFEQIREIDVRLSEHRVRCAAVEAVLDSQAVAERLNRLPRILGSGNPILVNLELSQHIDRIECFPDGQVKVRLTRLGALAGAVPLLKVDQVAPEPQRDVSTRVRQTRPKRRTRASTATDVMPSTQIEMAAEWATDPDRFAGLDERWFETCEFRIPRRTGWAEQNALEVARHRLAQKASLEQLAEHFGKAIPTIRKSLAFARQQGVDATEAVLRLPRGRQWVRENAVCASDYMLSTGSTLKAAARHFGVSEPTLRKALRIARSQTSQHS